MGLGVESLDLGHGGLGLGVSGLGFAVQIFGITFVVGITTEGAFHKLRLPPLHEYTKHIALMYKP